MAEQIAYLEAVVGADVTAFRREMSNVRNDVGLLSETMGGLGAIGRAATLAITAPLLIFGAEAVSKASAFEAEMRNVNSIAQLSETQFTALEHTVQQFGETTRGGATEAATALYTVYSAGISGSAALDLMRISTNTAEAGLADLTTTTQALTAMFLAYGGTDLPITQQLGLLEHQSDSLTETVQLGVGTMQTFATALGQIYPAAVAVGASFDDVNATTAFLTERGLTASRAAISLNAVLSKLLKPTDALKEAFQQLGVSTGVELLQKFGGLEGALQAIIGTAGTGDDALGKLTSDFNSIQAGRAILTLANNTDAWTASMDQFRTAEDGATGLAHQQQLETFSAHVDHLTAAMESAAISIGTVLIPIIEPLIDKVTALALSVADANPQILDLAVAFGILAAVVPPVVWLVSSLLSPVAALIIGVGLLAAEFAINFGSIKDTVSKTLSDIGIDVAGVSSAATSLIDALFPPTFATDVAAAVPTVTVPANQVLTFSVGAGQNLWDIWATDVDHTAFSWDAFKTAVGWTPHTMQPGEVVSLSGTFTQDMLKQFSDLGWNTTDALNALLHGGQTTTPFFGTEKLLGFSDEPTTQIRASVADIFTNRVVPVLNGVLTAVSGWFDINAGYAVNGITTLFEGDTGKGTNTAIYSAVTDLLAGNIYKAIDDVFPGLGTAISTQIGKWGDDITKSFPILQNSLRTLFDSAKTWVLTTGLPTIAGIGANIGGHLASSLVTAIAGIANFVSNPDTAKTAGNIASAISSYVTDTLLPAVETGWNDAVGAASPLNLGTLIPNVQSVLDGISNGISKFGKISGINEIITGIDKLGNGLVGFTKAINTPGTQELIFEIGLIAGVLASLIVNVSGGLLAGIGNALTPLGDGISYIATAITGAGGETADQRLHDVGNGLLFFIGAVGEIPTTILNSLGDFFKNTLGIDLHLPDFTAQINTWLTGLRADIAGNAALDSIMVKVNNTTFTFDTSDEQKFAIALNQLQEINPVLAGQISDYLLTHPITPEITSITAQVTPQTAVTVAPITGQSIINAAMTGQTIVQATPSGVHFTITANTPTAIADGSIIPTIDTPGITVTPNSWTLDGSGVTPTVTNPPNIPESVLPTGDLQTHLQVQAEQAATLMGDTLITAFASGGVTDPAIILNNFLIPTEANFTQYLGAGSPTVATIVSFVNTIAIGTGNASVLFGLLRIQVAAQSTAIVSSLTAQTPVMVTLLHNVQNAVNNLSTAFTAMANAARDALAAAATVPGAPAQTPIAGAMADGGNVLAGKNYIVGERGMELFSPHQNGTIISSSMLAGGMGGGSTTVTHQSLVVKEAYKLDDLMAEAKRRGLKMFNTER